MFGIAASWKGDSNPRVKAEISSVLKTFLFGWGVEFVIENARFFSWFEAHCHCLFVIADGNWADLHVALCSGVVGLWFLSLAGIEDNSLVSCKVEDAIGGEEWDWFGDGGVDAEDVFELEYLLGDDGGYSSWFHAKLQKNGLNYYCISDKETSSLDRYWFRLLDYYLTLLGLGIHFCFFLVFHFLA